MKAPYDNLRHVVDVPSDSTLVEGERQFVVPLGDAGLVIDPTDSEVADADNVREWCGLDEEREGRLRRGLGGNCRPADQYRLSSGI